MSRGRGLAQASVNIRLCEITLTRLNPHAVLVALSR